MPETTPHKIRYPEGKDPAKVQEYLQHLAEDVNRELDAIALSQLLHGTSGQLIVVQGTGAVAYKALKGDATLAADGTLTVGPGAIGTSKLADSAATTAKIAEGAITRAKMAAGLGALTWYTPKIIATEESRTNTAFGTLPTPDEVKEVVLPSNGLIVVNYRAWVKNSVSKAGSMALFIGANQLRNSAGIPAEVPMPGGSTGGEWTSFGLLHTISEGLGYSPSEPSADATTGQVVSASGQCLIFAAAGTYNIAVKFKASSGSITAKNRKLWVATLG